MIISSFVFLGLHQDLPSTSKISNVQLKIPLRVFSQEGLLIAEFGDERRKPVQINSVPEEMLQAILASEDTHFYSHFGVDFKGIIRALFKNYRDGSRQGASTITQQVARNYFLSSEQTYSRKIREIMLALKLESTLSKNDILTLYVNKIFLGHRAYGFSAASDVYYGKELNELTIAEQAMLAGLPKAPSRHNPISNPKRAESRRNYVLQRLLDNQWISKQEYTTAITSPITAKRQKSRIQVKAPYVAEMVRLKVIEAFGEEAYWQGLNIYTNIKQKNQQAANHALRKSLLAYDKRHGFRGALKSIKNTPVEEWLSELLDVQPSGSIIPAAVIEVNNRKAKLLTRNNENVTINITDSSWAKKYISADKKGNKPESFSKLIRKGDIIFIEPKTVVNEDQLSPAQQQSIPQQSIPQQQASLGSQIQQQRQQQWRLSQLPQVQGALVSTLADTGEIIALAGGFDFYFNNYNRVTQARRQPGSSLKPFIYSAALDKGYQPSTKINGAPIVIEDKAKGTLWRPHNYSNKIYPPTALRIALAKSMNLASIRLLRAIGVDYGREYISRFGIDSKNLANSLSLALGSGNATPLEVNTAYVALANTGYAVTPTIIDRIETPDGTIIHQNSQVRFCDNCSKADTIKVATEKITTKEPGIKENNIAARIMPKGTNFIMNDILRDVVRYGTARKANVLERDDLAGKTGTTNNYIDAWFNGYGGKIVTTTWVGFDTPQTLGHGEAGGRAALPMWIDYMKVALEGVPIRKYQKPADVLVLVDEENEKPEYQLLTSKEVQSNISNTSEETLILNKTSLDKRPQAKIDDLF